MDYNQQHRFLQKYSLASLLLIALTISIELACYSAWDRLAVLFQLPLNTVINFREITSVSIAFNTLITVAVIFAVIYLPKYLHFTIEPHKKIFWTIRIRWILAAIMLVFGLPMAISTGKYKALLIGLTLMIVINLLVRISAKKLDLNRLHYYRWFGTIYAVADGVALYLLFQSYQPNILLQALLCALAAHLAIQLNAMLPMVIFLGSMGFQSTPATLLFFVITAVSYGLTQAVRSRNHQNLNQTITDLIAFTGEEQGKVAELLLKSTGQLAANWHAANPQGKAAVEQWYCDNSPYYIYDLAQYHLAYKHIVFTLDVMSLSGGRVLDYGAGIGDLSLAMAERGANVTYFDVDGQSKEYARWQARQRNLKLNFASTHAELANQQFDTIIVLDVLEHLFEPEPVLEFLNEKLADGGLLIASAYFGATKSHPMHLDHKLDVAKWLSSHRLDDAKSWYFRYFASEAMRRGPMFVYRKQGRSIAENRAPSMA